MTTGYDSLKIEVALNQDPIGTASPTWTDITTSVQSATINRGRDAQWESYSPGAASFVFNQEFYATGSALVPNTLVRVSANDSGSVRRYLFAGVLRPQQGLLFDFHGSLSSSTIQAVDVLALMAERNFGTAGSSDVTSGTLIAQLAALPVPVFPAWQTEDIDVGQTIMQNRGSTSGTYLDVFQNIAFSEGGAFYILGDGTVTFDDRTAVSAKARLSSAQIAFDDTGAGDSTYGTNFSVWVPPVYTTASVTRANDDSLTVIDPITGVASQVAQTFTYSDSTAVTNYGPISFPPVTNALMSSNTEAAALAQRLVDSSSAVVLCPKTIRLYVRRSDAKPSELTLDAAIQRELRDFCTFANAGAGLSTNVHVERIQHTFDMRNKEWTCDLSFSSRDQLLATTDPTLWLILNDGSQGILNTNTLAW